MANNKVLENIYIELDALLDTRLGVLHQYNPDIAEAVVASGTYHTREEDSFEGVGKELFKELYKKRDKSTLMCSTVTNAVVLLKHFISVFTEQAIARPYHEGCRLVINTYPYDLTNEEREEISRAVLAWMRDIVPIELVSITPNNLTPEHCKKTYAIMIKYEYEDWMNIHAEAFKNALMPGVMLFVPAIYFNQKPSKEELVKIIKKAAHPMQALETLASPLVGLKLIDVSTFSIVQQK